MKVTLRPYQQAGVDELRACFKAGKRAPLFVLPTGGGKTITYAAIAEGAAAKGNRILILEHRKELIRQASLAVGGLGVRHQVVAPPGKVADIRRTHVARLGWPMIDNSSHVAVASVQTLARRMDWLQQFDPDVIVIDEAHHAVAGTWKRVIEALPRARLLGVTATPCRTDGQGLGDVFDTLVLGPTMLELIELGNLVRPRVFAPPMAVDLANAAHKGGDFDPAAAAELLDKPSVTGDAVDHYRKLAPGKPAIVFCSSVKHAEHVAADFRAAGFRFEVVTGDMDDDLRDERIMGLGDRRLHGICSVDVLSEGTDVPAAEVAILLRPTESESLYLQQVGRVLRPAEGKEFGLVLDHVGNVARHGLPHSDREWTLEGRKRGKRSTESEQTIRVQQCPKCYLAHEPAACCPGCGHVYEVQSRQIQQRDGELQEITDAPAPKVQTGRLQDMASLKAAGISTGRAAHILAARAEKEKLQNELRDLLARWSKVTGRSVRDGWGFAMADIRDMKPKQLRENIDKVGEALFLDPANDNQQQTGLALA